MKVFLITTLLVLMVPTTDAQTIRCKWVGEEYVCEQRPY